MFFFVCKTILHSSRHRPFHNLLHCSQNYTSILSRSYISTTTSNQHSFTVSYLINSCGLSPESALSASKRVQFDSPEKPDSVIAFFKNHGFTESQVSKVFKACPRLLLARPQETLLPKLEFFYSIGFSSPELANTLSLCPVILNRSLKNHIIPSFDQLSDLLQSRLRAITVIKQETRLLHDYLEYSILPKVNFLRDNGVSKSNIAMFVYHCRRSYLTPLESFKNEVKLVKEMGFDPLRVQFVKAIVAKLAMSKSVWERKINAYMRWGWSEKEFLAAFRKDPWCMRASEDKIITVMDFFVNQMGLKSSVVARRPVLVSLSMEKRFIPRAVVLQFMLSKGLVKSASLISLFQVPEKTFLQKFMSHEEAPQLLKLYKEKLDVSETTQRSA